MEKHQETTETIERRHKRLEAQANVVARDLAVTDQRIENFEESRHQRQWEVGGEKWSLSDVDRELSRSERDIDFNERRNDYFENRLSWRGLLPHPSQLNPFRNPFDISPSKLSPLPPALNPSVRARYREEMEARQVDLFNSFLISKITFLVRSPWLCQQNLVMIREKQYD